MQIGYEQAMRLRKLKLSTTVLVDKRSGMLEVGSLLRMATNDEMNEHEWSAGVFPEEEQGVLDCFQHLGCF